MSPRRAKPEEERRRLAFLETKRRLTLRERLDRLVKFSRVPEFQKLTGATMVKGKPMPATFKGRTLRSVGKAVKLEWVAAAPAQITQREAAKLLMAEFEFPSPGALLMWLSRQKKAGKKAQATHTRRRRRQEQAVISRR